MRTFLRLLAFFILFISGISLIVWFVEVQESYYFKDTDWVSFFRILRSFLVGIFCLVLDWIFEKMEEFKKGFDAIHEILRRLDSYDIPLKPVAETKEDPVDESKDQKTEEFVAEQPIEEKTDNSELTVWKEKSIRGIKASIVNGRIDEERGNELIRRVQAATQIPEPKK